MATKAKLTVAILKRKYPHPRRACESTGADLEDDYCVAGALCMEAEVGQHFPEDDQIVAALYNLTTGRVSCYTMSDKQHEQFHTKIGQMIAANDAGDFKMAWACLRVLLQWKPDNDILNEREARR